MNELPSRFPASKSEFVKLVEGTEYGEILRDESRLEKIVVDVLKASDDPMAREIGEGLAGGTMSWRTIATTSAYADFLKGGLTALQQFDFNGLAEDLAAAEAEAERPDADGRDRRGDDDGEDLWQGLRGNRQ
jgi:hypothetical protein